MSKHTPTPWVAEKSPYPTKSLCWAIRGPQGHYVASIRGDQEMSHFKVEDANAEYIVLAVNHHDELVAALREIKAACPRYCDDDAINAGLLRIMQTVNFALAELEAK